MKTACLLLAAVLALASLQGAEAPQAKNDPRALALLKRVDDLWRGDASQTRMTMKVKTRHYERSITLQGWSRGQDYSLVRVLKPEKDKGVSTLKAKETLYTYLPRTDRVIKLSSGMMGSSWMGSHFTNDDLIQESRMSRDYDVVIDFEGQRQGRKVTALTLTPKPDAPVVWGQIKTVIDDETLMPQKTEYFDEDLKKVREMSFSEIRELGGRTLPTHLRLTPSDKPGEFTELIYEELNLNPQGVDESFFSLATLKKRKL